jgi:hypothetical protein
MRRYGEISTLSFKEMGCGWNPGIFGFRDSGAGYDYG